MEGDSFFGVLGLLIALLGAYIAVIHLLHTETAMRATGAPWFSWVRWPPTKTVRDVPWVVGPVVVYYFWAGFIRRMVKRPEMPAAMVVVGAFIGVLGMNAAVAMMDGGVAAIWKPFDSPSEYFSDVGAVRDVKSFLHSYVAHFPDYSLHTRTHPPGAVLLLYGVARLIGPGVKTAAWSAVILTASAVVPFALLARRVAGRRVAAMAIGLYGVAPSLVLFGATSMDGVFLVALLWAVYFVQRAMTEGGLGDAVRAGMAVAVAAMFSYVVVCIAAMMFVYGLLEVWRDRGRARKFLKAVGVCVAVVGAIFVAIYFYSGFDYLACLKRSRFYDHYAMGTFRMTLARYLDISASNLAAFLIGVGLPAVVLWAWETRKSAAMDGAADRMNVAVVAAVVFFSFAHLFTHETERVWMFFVPLALLAAAGWIGRREGIEDRLLGWAMGLMLVQTMLMQWLLFTIW